MPTCTARNNTITTVSRITKTKATTDANHENHVQHHQNPTHHLFRFSTFKSLMRKNTAHTYLNVDIKENEVKKCIILLLPGYTYYPGIYYKNEIVQRTTLLISL